MLEPPLESWRPHLGEILDPPLHSVIILQGSFYGLILFKSKVIEDHQLI